MTIGNKVRFIGDVHGKISLFTDIVNNTPKDHSAVQVGDLGVGFGQGEYWHQKLETLMDKNRCRFIRGNHDNPEICKSMSQWIADGTVEDDIFYCGGAWSIDVSRRTEGYDWWRDEELSWDELYRIIELYRMVRPRVMVAHEFPHEIAKKLFFEDIRSPCFRMKQYNTRTGTAFQALIELHKPSLWIGGHYHFDVDTVIDGTRYICLDELSYADIDLNTLDILNKSKTVGKF